MAKIVMTKKMLKEMHELLNSLHDEFQLKFTPKGIESKSVDPAHVALVHIKIPKESLVSFEYEPATEEDVGIDIDWLPKVYRRGEQGNVALTWNGYKATLEYKIRGMPVVEHRNAPDMTGRSEPKVPNMTLPCKFDVDVADLSTIIAYIDEYGTDHIAIKSQEGRIYLTGGGDTFDFEAILCPAPSEERFKSFFPLDYFSNIVRASTSAEKITIELGTDYPIVLSGKTREGIEFTFMLAPRLESS